MSQVNRFIRKVEGLHELLDQTAKPCVAVLGSFNSGKSTLINGLLGAEVSPVGVVPTTNCLLDFDHGHTYKASYQKAKQNLSFQHIAQLHSFLESCLKTPTGRVVIEYPSLLLKKCRLVDTPGIDGSSDAGLLAEQAAREADHVVYIFHQRGIEDLNRLFLYKLASVWKKKDINKLSFWLNCNYGLCDGSSLETTRAVLREVFLHPVRCNVINTRDQASLKVVNLFLQVELARNTCLQVFGLLKKLDQELPGRIAKAVRIKEDSSFLSEFWRVQQTSRNILETGQLLHSLPAVTSELEHTLRTANLMNLGAGTTKPGGQAYYPNTTSITESRKRLLTLTTDLLSDKTTDGLIDLPAIKIIAHEIQAERFTVAAMGGFSTGKTTFFNALLKEALLPTADGPTTSAVTRITHGLNKKATIHFPLQTTISICEHVGDKVGLYREQLQALERWLAPSNDAVNFVECFAGGFFQRLGRQEVLEQLRKVREYFAAGAYARAPASSRIPGVFRLISQKANNKNPLPDRIRVTFKDTWLSEFNLAEQSGREQFMKALGPENAFRIDQVVVEHPAEFLKYTDYLDTPGLDWIQKHHYLKTSCMIRTSDAHLVFLNGKHILNQMDRQHMQNLFLPQLDNSFQALPTHERGKYFFVINYADVLNLAEREAVCNFVRTNLGSLKGKYTPGSSAPNIYLISALKALSGDAAYRLGALLKALEESILKYRAADFYLGKIARLLGLLNEASLRAAQAYLERNATGNDKLKLRKAQENLRYYRSRLKEIRSFISPAKPP